jgi:hypothetical protein
MDWAFLARVGVKSIQRGIYSGSGGNVTIGEVDVNKAFTISESKGSAGSVKVSGTMTTPALTASQGSSLLNIGSGTGSAPMSGSVGGYTITNGNISIPSQTGTFNTADTDLTVKEYGARLVSGTQLYCDGPCNWQIIELW